MRRRAWLGLIAAVAALSLGCKTAEAKQMLFTAKVVSRLRACLLNEDVAEAGVTLEAVRGKLLASVAMPEVPTRSPLGFAFASRTTSLKEAPA